MTLNLRRLASVEHAVLLCVFFVIFITYLMTLPNTVTLEDDGLFLMSSYFTGISHPPGYPLYSLVSWFFGILPIGSFPFRIHAMSAFFAAGTCTLLCIFVRSLNLSWSVAIIVAFAYAYSRAFWSQAIIAEVYSLNSFLVLCLLVLALFIYKNKLTVDKGEENEFYKIESEPDLRALYWGSFIYGLSLSVHIPLVILSTPSLLILLYPYRQQIFKQFPKILFFLLLGLTPYAWMIWRSNTDVVINFYGAIQSISDLSYIFSREGYAHVDISGTAGLLDKINYILFLLNEIFNQFAWLGFIFVVIGFVHQWWKWRISICLSLLLLFLFNSFFFLLVIYFDYDYLSRYVFSVYPLLAYAVMSIWLGNGLSFVAELLTKYFQVEQYEKHIVTLFGVAIITLMFFQNITVNNRHDYDWANEYAINVLNNLPEDADLFVSGDIHTFTLGYMHHVEKVRPDIQIYNLQGLVFSNRLFHPIKTSENDKLIIQEKFVTNSKRPACTADAINSNYAHIDYWLFSCFSNEENIQYDVKLNAEFFKYIKKIVNDNSETDPWTIHHRQQLIKKMGTTLGKMSVNQINENINDYKDYLSMVTKEFYGALGYLEGINSYPTRVKDINEMIRVIKQVELVPELAKKHDKASFYTIRGDVSVLAGNLENGIKEYRLAINIWPDNDNSSINKLLEIYLKENREAEHFLLKLRFSL